MKKIFFIFLFFVFIILIGCKPQTPTTAKSTEAPEISESIQETAEIKCKSDEDCGGRIVQDPYCFQGNSFGTLIINKCINPNMKDAYCVQESNKGLIQECAENQFCQKGVCKNYENCTDSDGGKNYYSAGTVRTNDGAVYEDECRTGAKLIEYYCSSDNRAFSEVKSCVCENEACVSGY